MPPKLAMQRSGWTLFLALFIVRVINAINLRTFFQPDEYFQSLEPAWQATFGEGSGAWITWEWRQQLRSSIHPLIFTQVYRLAVFAFQFMQTTPEWRAEILITVPKILQGLFAASTDFFTYQFAYDLYGGDSPAVSSALALTLLSPWQWFASVRTLSNSLETTLTIFALYCWPWKWFLAPPQTTPNSKDKPDSDGKDAKTSGAAEDAGSSGSLPTDLYASLLAAALACVLRPTNVLVWATISITLITRYGDFNKAFVFGRVALECAFYVLSLSAALDWTMYDALVFPPYRFLYFNVVQSLAVFYGKNRPDYYFTEGLPLLLTTSLPFAAIGMWQALRERVDVSNRKRWEERQVRFMLALAVVTSVVALSLVSHKEVRFIYPLLPLLLILAAKPMSTFLRKYRPFLLAVGLSATMAIIFYTTSVHQRGVVDVVHYLRREYEGKYLMADDTNTQVDLNPKMSVGFLMPCHSTPWRSHLVYDNINAWALTCEPPIDQTPEERETYLDEADQFYADPEVWLQQEMKDVNTIRKVPTADHGSQQPDSTRKAWPHYLVFFEQLQPVMDRVLKDTMYEQCFKEFNTHWHDDWRRQGDVVAYCIQR